jgi:hypothetical protein
MENRTSMSLLETVTLRIIDAAPLDDDTMEAASRFTTSRPLIASSPPSFANIEPLGGEPTSRFRTAPRVTSSENGLFWSPFC